MRTGGALHALLACAPLWIASCTSTHATRSSVGPAAQELVGSWKLVAYERKAVNGETSEPFGPSPQGRLTYFADGRMAVQIMDPRRPSFRGNDYRRGEPAEIEQAFEGYFAYFGTYSVDASTITHHVEAALYPNYIGRHEARSFTLDDGRLTLTTPLKVVDGVEARYEVTWERER